MSQEQRVGSTIAGHKLEKLLGSGSTAVVYLGVQEYTGKMRAFKFPINDECDSYFRREMEQLSVMSHPHILQPDIHCLDSEDIWLAFPFIEHSEGVHSVADYLNKYDPMRAAHAVAVAKQVLDALVHAHSKSILHRDIKPNNILINSNLTAYLTDFNLAKEQENKTLQPSLSGSASRGGASVYRSPEQELGRTIDERTDVYSLGLTLVTLLVGEPWKKAVKTHPSGKNVPDGLAQVIDQATEYEHAKRLPSASAFLAKLNALPHYYSSEAHLAIATSMGKLTPLLQCEHTLVASDVHIILSERDALYDLLARLGELTPVPEVEARIGTKRDHDMGNIQNIVRQGMERLRPISTSELTILLSNLPLYRKSAVAWNALRGLAS